MTNKSKAAMLPARLLPPRVFVGILLASITMMAQALVPALGWRYLMMLVPLWRVSFFTISLFSLGLGGLVLCLCDIYIKLQHWRLESQVEPLERSA